ncbi:hypothetical protein PVIIG_06090 [Plasmodium vivax India VII]|uniref:VIR protein n=1 Tax=Plasmodium vivax India VII TaxID=1077284 RepID=A0A0J9UUG9_PLAVI|nr:hypothetical protein PVIIG_06090 [Plasmodium vivax India VII]
METKNKVWDTYNEFDNPVEHDENKHWYDTFCDPFMKELGDDDKEHKNFCLKLIRNLGHYSKDFKFLKFKPEYCTNLNNWVYNSIKKYSIPKEIITGCYNDYKRFTVMTNNISICSYYSYEDIYEEPLNIIILNIFESNMHIIQNALDGRYDSIFLPLRMYICECIEIYKKMYKKYCPKMDTDSEKKKSTCDILESIKTTYNSFISGKSYQNNKMPSLENDTEEYFAMCPQYNPSSKLTLKENRRLPVLGSLTEVKVEGTDDESSYVGHMNYQTDGLPSLSEDNGENQFSPARRLVHSGIQGNRGRMNSNFYEDGPTDLLFDGVQGEDMSSYTPSYNIGYGSV